MALSKKIALTVVGHTTRLSSDIKFYQYDQLHLIFEINEYGIDVENNEDGDYTTKTIMPINPLNATLFFETPLGIDSLEHAEIIDNTIIFHLWSVHTQHVGKSKMQIQLTDGDCCQITLPEFEFEIKKPIYDTETILRRILLEDEEGKLIVDEDGVTFYIGEQVFALSPDDVHNTVDGFVTKQIQEYDLDTIVTGNEDLLVQDDGVVKRVKALDLVNNLVDDVSVDIMFQAEGLTPTTLGGIEAGTDLNNMTIQEVLTQLLYPYVAPSVSAFLTYSPSGTLFEKGTVVEITALNGSFIQRSEEIVNIKFLDGTEILYERADELESNTVYTYTFGEPIRITNDMNNTRFRVSVIDGVNEIFANTIAFSFCYPYYFDVIENDTVLSSNLIKNMNKKIETKGNKTYTYTTNNQRMVIAYPKSYGNLSKIIDQNNFDVTATFTKSEINVVGKDGTSQTYYVYVNNASSVENFRMTFQY